MDPAILRPGRLDRLIHFDLPDRNERFKILEYYIHKSTNENYDNIELLINDIADKTKNYTGADLQSIVYNAFLISIQKAIENNKDQSKIEKEHMEKALASFKPSLSNKDILFYDNLKRKLLNLENNDPEINEKLILNNKSQMNELNMMKTTLY